MAGVGVVQLFDPSTEALISTSKTLTESAINMAVTAEEARGGQGNVLLGKYYHDTSFGLTLTDQLFDLNYLALNCGGAITAGSDVIKNEQVTVGIRNLMMEMMLMQRLTLRARTQLFPKLLWVKMYV